MLNKSKLGKVLLCTSIGLSLAGGYIAISPQTAKARSWDNAWNRNDDSFDYKRKPTKEFNRKETSYSNSGSGKASADRIIATGGQYMGTPYKFGAKKGDTRQFDCSSFTQIVYGQHGIKLPRSSRQQSNVGFGVSKHNMKKGDLLFFRSPNHIGIYMGDNKMLHTYKKGIGVTTSSLDEGRWKSRLQKVRRVL